MLVSLNDVARTILEPLEDPWIKYMCFPLEKLMSPGFYIGHIFKQSAPIQCRLCVMSRVDFTARSAAAAVVAGACQSLHYFVLKAILTASEAFLVQGEAAQFPAA